MSVTRVALVGLQNAGFQRITTNSTASSLNSTVRQARVLDVSVETQNVRYRMDGTLPTATTGVLLVTGAVYRFEGYNGTAALKFIGAASGAVLNVQGYKVAPQ